MTEPRTAASRHIGWAYGFKSSLSLDQLRAVLERAGPWEWMGGESYWYGDYLNRTITWATGSMSVNDERNILKIGPDRRATTYGEITPAMVEAVRQRIEAAGGALVVWAVLHEDTYETKYGDGYYVHVKGVALNRTDARRLAGLAGNSKDSNWTVKDYRLALASGVPAFAQPWTRAEEFTIGDFVAILSEIPPNATASKLHTGTGRRKDGPFIALPPK